MALMAGYSRVTIFTYMRFRRPWIIESFDRVDKFMFLVAILVVLAIFAVVLRLVSIEGRAVHFDEAIQTYWSWRLIEFGSYEYRGQYHGPLLYYLSFPAFLIRESSVVVGREVAAVASVLIFPGLFLMRSVLRWSGVLFVAAIFTFHPIFVWTARFYRSDTLMIVLLVLSVAFYSWYKTEPSKKKGAAIGILLALAVSTTEISYLWVLVLIAPLLLLAYGEARTGETLGSALRDKLPSGGILIGVASGILGLIVMYSGWPPDPLSVPHSIGSGLATWIDRSGGSASSTFYLTNFVGSAPVLTTLAMVGCVSTFLQPKANAIRWMFISWLLIGSVLLSLLPHQTLWLHVHILAPMTFVASFAVVDILKLVRIGYERVGVPRARYRNRMVLAALLVITVAASVESYQLNPLTTYFWTDKAPSPDHRSNAMRMASDSAVGLNCTVLIGPDAGDAQPFIWFLRQVTYRAGVPEEDLEPAVWINQGSIDGLNGADQFVISKRGPWWVYEPESRCE